MTLCLTCPDEPPRTAMVGYNVCGRCKQLMAGNLGEMPGLYVITEFELNPGSGTGRGAERPIGLRISALNMLAGHDLLGTLGSWEQDWRETFDHSPPPTRIRLDRDGYKLRTMPVKATLSEIVTYLLTYLDRACREHPAIDEFSREVHQTYVSLLIAARLAAPTSWYVTCPRDFEGESCGKRLRVTAELDDYVRCYQCGTSWTTRRLLLVAAADSYAEIWLDPVALSEITGVPERTLRRWAVQGTIARAHGRYSLGSVREAMMVG